MLYRRYGTTVQRVEPNFDARAMTEVGFRRTGGDAIPTEEFEASYERVGGHELTAEASAPVKDEAEAELMERLLARLNEVIQGAGEETLVLVESQAGHDYPKTRDRMTTVGGSTTFHWTVDPPLRVGVYRKR
jgi:hypothetical protein